MLACMLRSVSMGMDVLMFPYVVMAVSVHAFGNVYVHMCVCLCVMGGVCVQPRRRPSSLPVR